MTEDWIKTLKEKAERAYEIPEDQRGYSEAYNIWVYEHTAGIIDSWDEGLEVEIYNGEDLKAGKYKDPVTGQDLPQQIRDLGDLIGKMVRINSGIEEDKIYKLLGISYTFVDFYYILEIPGDKKLFISCVSGIEEVK